MKTRSFGKISIKKERFDYSFIKKMIKKNDYIKKFKTNGKKNFESLSYLVDKKYSFSQSDCIKLGISMEKILSDIILEKNKNLENIRPKNKKGSHERDHLFVNHDTKTIFYSELKSNLNLDTEKCKATVNKCKDIYKEVKLEYPGYSVKWWLLGLRYIEKTNINKTIFKKFEDVKENVIGVNEYLENLNTGVKFTEEEYSFFINEIAKSFKKN